MDVEGFELQVLKGAVKTLRRDPQPTWLLEIMLADGLIPGGRNAAFRETFRYFWDEGYECRTLDGNFAVVTSSRIAEWISAGTGTGNHSYLFQSASCKRLSDAGYTCQQHRSVAVSKP